MRLSQKFYAQVSARFLSSLSCRLFQEHHADSGARGDELVHSELVHRELVHRDEFHAVPRENVLLPQNDDGYARGNVRHARDYVPRGVSNIITETKSD